MATAFLLDTNVISETVKRNPHPNVVRFFETAEELWIPAGALLEINMGIAKVANTNPQKAVELGRWYNDLIESGIDVAATTQSVIDKWGVLLGDVRLLNLTVPRVGHSKPRAGQDLHIAAAALVRGLAIATFNVKDFLLINEYYPLAGVYNPKEDFWYSKMLSLEEYIAAPLGLPTPDNLNTAPFCRELKFLKRA